MDTQRRVLHVDDEPGFAELTARYLERADGSLVVDTEASPVDALERLERETYDCVVSDFQMPGMDGLEFLETLREERGLDVPFVFFTGHGREDVAMQALNLGADRYLQKGGDPKTQYGLLAEAITGSVDQHRLQTQHHEAERRYRSLFENNPLVIWEEDFSAGKEYVDALAGETDDLQSYLDEHPEELDRIVGRIEVIDVSKNALDYYEADSKTQVVENLDQLMTEESRATNRAMWVAVAEGKTEFRKENVLRTFSGARRHEILEMNVPEAYADDLSRVYITATDITERKRHERELERQNVRLNKFASIVSHDLRNPLNVASGQLELARDACVCDGTGESFTVAADALERMEAIIEATLTLTRQGETVVDTEYVDLRELADRAWAMVDSREAGRLVVADDLTLLGDGDRLQQVLENLFRNCVEHGSTSSRPEAHDSVEHAGDLPGTEDAVTVRVGRLGTAHSGEGADGFFVADDGPGIDPERRETVFEPGETSENGGAGFGLAIVREMVEAHGWTVGVTESETGGARFEIRNVEVVDPERVGA